MLSFDLVVYISQLDYIQRVWQTITFSKSTFFERFGLRICISSWHFSAFNESGPKWIEVTYLIVIYFENFNLIN